MEKRIIGALLVIVGIIGLVLSAYYFVNHATSEYSVKLIAVYGILGIIFFASGIGLIRRTRDVINKDEHVS